MPLCTYISLFGRAGQVSVTSAEFRDSAICILISQGSAWKRAGQLAGDRGLRIIKGLEEKPFDFIAEGNNTLTK